ncbi:MAG: glycosyltransferase [Lachnospiraceae bacterium]|nr:glycosyltransferase [Lachnospiraceae bacterium]
MRFTIIVVSLNAGEELKKTVLSVLNQRFHDYEILVKDGGSGDGSVKELPANERLRIIVKDDLSIYDAMNQAVAEARGDYLLFLNCGDYLDDDKVLGKAAKALAMEPADIYYGDLYRRTLDSTDVAPDRITDLVCYRNVPCHQVCFYAKRLFEKRGYLTKYRVRADYEHFLYCYYKLGAKCVHLPFTVCSYMGGGFSETKDHKAEAKQEHAVITEQYMGKKAKLFNLIMILTLQPLREAMAGSRLFSGLYHKLKAAIYGLRSGRKKE